MINTNRDPSRPLAGRTVAVTGASRGIGSAIVELLTANGARVIGGARSIDHLQVDGASFVSLDVTAEASVLEFAQAAMSLGADTLINNAGVGRFGPLEQTSVADYRHVMDTNVLGLILASKAFIPHFKARHAAGMASQAVIVTSDVSTRTFSQGGLYTASKFAQRALTQALAFECESFGLRVTEIRPGMTDTHFNESTPGAPDRALHLRPMDIAEAVLYALTAPQRVRVDEIVVHPTVQAVVF